MIGDLREMHLQPDEYPEHHDPKVDAVLNAADEIQQQWAGSFVEIIVHIPDSPYRGGECTDNYKLYSVRLESK